MNPKKKTNTKRNRKRDDIAMAYRIDALPGRISKASFFQTLIDLLDGEIEDLPRGWAVTWLWRNSRKSKLRSDTFQGTIANSRDSFMTLIRRRLRRDLDSLRPQVRKKRRRTKKRKSRKNRRKMSKLSRKKTGRKARRRKRR